MKDLQILLIEDDVYTSAAISRLLGQFHNVVSVSKWQDAVAAAEFSQFDLVLSDLGLPEKDGWELLPLIRRVQPKVPAIAISGHSFDSDRERSAVAGFTVHLSKPITADRLYAAIAKLFPDRKPFRALVAT